MNGPGKIPPHANIPEWAALAIPSGLIIALSLSLQILAGWPVFDDRWIGPDSYMRLVRIFELLNGADWWNPVSVRGNHPEGETLHWSRVFDLWVIMLSIPFVPFFEMQIAIKIAAQIASPVLRLGVLFAVLWSVRPISTAGVRLAIGAVFAMQFSILTYLGVGRPDHHGLILLTWALLLGLLFRLFKSDWGMKQTIATGLILGIALWTSIEGLFATLMVFSGLGLTWLASNEDRARQLFCLSLAVSLTIVANIILEFTPANWLSEIYDKISFPHLSVFVVMTALCGILMLVPQQKGIMRVGTGLIAAIVLFVFAYAVFPKLLAGPMVDIHPRIIDEWYARNAEVEGLFGVTGFRYNDPKAIVYGLQLLIILPYFAFRAWSERDVERRRWVLLAALACVTSALVISELRWSIYFELLASIGLGLVVAMLVVRLESWNIATRTLGRIVLICGFMLGPQLLGLMVAASQSKEPEVTTAKCDMKVMAAYLSSKYADREMTILASNFSGPELLYRTHHNVVATPYHRNSAGILDSIDVLEGSNLDASINILERRNVDLILICPKPNNEPAAAIFDQRPNWIKEIAVPTTPIQSFRLFEVIR